MLVAVDTGGTKTLVTSFTKDGQIGLQVKFPTPPDQGTYVRELSQILHTNFGDQEVEAIVIGMPGIVKDGVAVWCNNLEWKNFDVKGAFKGILGSAPILVENDANLAGLAEAHHLKTMPNFVLYVTISTGIGSGVITEGHIDPQLRYSEAGRSLVEYNGAVREWEDFASGKAILKTYRKYARDITSKRTWRQIADRISRGFLTLIPVLQPDTIVIGGSIGTFFDQYKTDLTTILRARLPDHIPLPKIVKAKHPELAVIYGCYYYALDVLAAR